MNGEGAIKADSIGMFPQKSRANRVEGAAQLKASAMTLA
jgi:hypothetical protein